MNIENVMKIAKEKYGKDMSPEEAQAYIDSHSSGMLSDDELDNVAGGCSSGGSTNLCPRCHRKLTIHHEGDGRTPDSWVYATCTCGYDSRR